MRFPGQYFDAETGKHYNYFRDYDPSTGRYIQSDPLGIDVGLSTYGYVRGQPLSLTDVFGLAPCCDANLPSGPIGLAALTCFSEATSNCREAWFEKVAITDTIFNRARANRSYWGGSDVGDVIRQPGQFQGVGGSQWGRGQRPGQLDPMECAKLKDCINAATGSADTTFFDFNGFNQTRRSGRVKIRKHYFRIER